MTTINKNFEAGKRLILLDLDQPLKIQRFLKLANIAIYRLFDRMCVSFGVAIICLCKPF